MFAFFIKMRKFLTMNGSTYTDQAKNLCKIGGNNAKHKRIRKKRGVNQG